MALKQQPTISCAAHPKKQQSVPNLEENDYVGSIERQYSGLYYSIFRWECRLTIDNCRLTGCLLEPNLCVAYDSTIAIIHRAEGEE